jgi:catechol 2,3-dioxygenase-like lactoylglutathione lyase family enzyme
MKIQDAYPVIVTNQLKACRDFYQRWFGFEVGFEANWFIWLYSATDQTSENQRSYSLAFMHSSHPSNPPGPECFSGQGMFLTLQVEDASAEYERLRQAGLKIEYGLHDEPWGQRRFMVRDPAGTMIDVVQQTEPEPDYWLPYISTAE